MAIALLGSITLASCASDSEFDSLFDITKAEGVVVPDAGGQPGPTSIYGIWGGRIAGALNASNRLEIRPSFVKHATRCTLDSTVITAGVQVSARVPADGSAIEILEPKTDVQTSGDLTCTSGLTKSTFTKCTDEQFAEPATKLKQCFFIDGGNLTLFGASNKDASQLTKFRE